MNLFNNVLYLLSACSDVTMFPVAGQTAEVSTVKCAFRRATINVFYAAWKLTMNS